MIDNNDWWARCLIHSPWNYFWIIPLLWPATSLKVSLFWQWEPKQKSHNTFTSYFSRHRDLLEGQERARTECSNEDNNRLPSKVWFACLNHIIDLNDCLVRCSSIYDYISFHFAFWNTITKEPTKVRFIAPCQMTTMSRSVRLPTKSPPFAIWNRLEQNLVIQQFSISRHCGLWLIHRRNHHCFSKSTSEDLHIVTCLVWK